VTAQLIDARTDTHVWSDSGDMPDAERERLAEEMKQLAIAAYETDPDDAVAILYYGNLATEGDDRLRDLSDVERPLALEPNNTEVLRIAAMVANGIGHFDAAIVLGERMISINPLCIVCYLQLLDSYINTGNLEKAKELQRRRIALVDDFGGATNLAHDLVAAGRPDEALEIYARIGDKDMTLALLSKIIEAEPHRFEMFVWDPDFAFLHDTPEWLGWRKDAGLDEESLAAIEFKIPDFGD